MFTIQTAVTIVTAGIASSLFGFGSVVFWTVIITAICFLILIRGRYKVLDSLMKVIVILLTISTLVSVVLAVGPETALNFSQVLPTDALSVTFLIAFMGWMPAPLDISIWHSIWTVEKQKLNSTITRKQSRFDFNVGFITTIILGVGFLALGAIVMHNSGESFSAKGGEFANQLISMYTFSLGQNAKIIIGIAALTTMFSTTLTTLDSSPRVMSLTTELLQGKLFKNGYFFWLALLVIGTLAIFLFFVSEMGVLIKIATILSFLTAPFYAIINFKLITGKNTPINARPSKSLQVYSLICIGILVAFTIWFLTTL